MNYKRPLCLYTGRIEEVRDQDGLLLSTVDVPSIINGALPAAGSILFSSANYAGCALPSVKNSFGEVVAMQSHLGLRRAAWLQANGAGITSISNNGVPTSSAGTVTGRGISDTNAFSTIRRVGYVSAAAAGSSAGIRPIVGMFPSIFRSNASNMGGFFYACSFGISDSAYVGGSRLFVGLLTGTALIGNVNPSALTNIIGVGADAHDTALSIMHNDAAGAVTKVNTGMPADTTNTDWYTLFLFCPPNHDRVYYRLQRLTGLTGELSFFPVSGIGEITSNLPAANQLLAWQVWRNNGETTASVGIDFGQMYIETGV